MQSIILPIKIEYINKIAIGEKCFEYRKCLCKNDIEKIYMYATSPISKVVGEVEVKGKLYLLKDKLWERTYGKTGVEEKFFYEYFKKNEYAGAYILGNVKMYNIPKDLTEFNINYAPQSFVYVES